MFNDEEEPSASTSRNNRQFDDLFTDADEQDMLSVSDATGVSNLGSVSGKGNMALRSISGGNNTKSSSTLGDVAVGSHSHGQLGATQGAREFTSEISLDQTSTITTSENNKRREIEIGDVLHHLEVLHRTRSRYTQMIHATLLDYKLHTGAFSHTAGNAMLNSIGDDDTSGSGGAMTRQQLFRTAYEIWNNGNGQFVEVRQALEKIREIEQVNGGSSNQNHQHGLVVSQGDNNSTAAVVINDFDKDGGSPASPTAATAIPQQKENSGDGSGRKKKERPGLVLGILCCFVLVGIFSISFVGVLWTSENVLFRALAGVQMALVLSLFILGYKMHGIIKKRLGSAAQFPSSPGGGPRSSLNKPTFFRAGSIGSPMSIGDGSGPSPFTPPGTVDGGESRGPADFSIPIPTNPTPYSPVPFLSQFVAETRNQVMDEPVGDITAKNGTTLIIPFEGDREPLVLPAAFLIQNAKVVIMDTVTRNIIHWGEDLDSIFPYSSEDHLGQKFSKVFILNATADKNYVELGLKDNPRMVYDAIVRPVTNSVGEEVALFFVVQNCQTLGRESLSSAKAASVHLPVFSAEDTNFQGSKHPGNPSGNSFISTNSRKVGAASMSYNPLGQSTMGNHQPNTAVVYLTDPQSRHELMEALWSMNITVQALRSVDQVRQLLKSNKLSKFDTGIFSVDELTKDDVDGIKRSGIVAYYHSTHGAFNPVLPIRHEQQVVGALTGSTVKQLVSQRKMDMSLSYAAALSLQFRKVENKVHFDNYNIINKLGHGNFGEVFKAELGVTGGVVAIKRLFPGKHDKARIEQFISEVNIMSKLAHPNIVQYLYTQRDGDTICIFMECCDGLDLTSRLVHPGYTPASRLVNFYQIVDAVQYLHNNGIIHRDLKTENVLFRGDIVKLSDFGTATFKRSLSGGAQQIKTQGTLQYMAPEVLLGEYSEVNASMSSDVWSLGIILAEMMGIKLPHLSLGYTAFIEYFKNMPLNKHIEVAAGSSASKKNNPAFAEVVKVIESCLQRNPKQRPSASEILSSKLFDDGDMADNISISMEGKKGDAPGLEQSLDSAMFN